LLKQVRIKRVDAAVGKTVGLQPCVPEIVDNFGPPGRRSDDQSTSEIAKPERLASE
jgi:hypothetical protein